jgi:hypothetical protein
VFADTTITFTATCPALHTWKDGKCVCEAGRTLSWVSAAGVPLANPTQVCLACSRGMTSTPKADNTHTCEFCPRGTVSTTGGDTADVTVAALVAGGKMVAANLCTGLCPAGKYGTELQQRGSTGHTAANVCTDCQKGTYQPAEGSPSDHSCIACGDGEFALFAAAAGATSRAATCTTDCSAETDATYKMTETPTLGLRIVDPATADQTKTATGTVGYDKMDRCVKVCPATKPFKDVLTKSCVASCGTGFKAGFETAVKYATAGVSTANTIVSATHGFADDATIMYAPGPAGESIAELSEGQVYVVDNAATNTFQLKIGAGAIIAIAKQAANGAVFSASSNARICVSEACGVNQRTEARACVDCAPGSARYALTTGVCVANEVEMTAHGFFPDDPVQYRANAKTPITGLVEGTTYYVMTAGNAAPANFVALSLTPSWSAAGATALTTLGTSGAAGNQFTTGGAHQFVYAASANTPYVGLGNGGAVTDAAKLLSAASATTAATPPATPSPWAVVNSRSAPPRRTSSGTAARRAPRARHPGAWPRPWTPRSSPTPRSPPRPALRPSLHVREG